MCKKKHPTETLRRNTSPESAPSKQRTALSYTLTNDQLTKITNQELPRSAPMESGGGDSGSSHLPLQKEVLLKNRKKKTVQKAKQPFKM